ncbi:hypothetical protein L1080_037355 [Rhodococcus sp. MSC1_016]|uniref:hypothetical protein n=1 Tax=Rhodococcus sp. MSC1_016 TaxID=2909266 RepID=UPI00202EBEEC|nr:hypothetical protein [Rhodococcus sp. MSC1_016]
MGSASESDRHFGTSLSWGLLAAEPVDLGISRIDLSLDFSEDLVCSISKFRRDGKCRRKAGSSGLEFLAVSLHTNNLSYAEPSSRYRKPNPHRRFPIASHD